MNILIGLVVVLLLAHAIGGYSSTVEQRQSTSRGEHRDLTADQRDECETWRGWPKHYRPWFCGE